MYANYCDLVKIAKGRRIPIAISFFAVFFFVFLMQLGLRRAAAFVSCPLSIIRS